MRYILAIVLLISVTMSNALEVSSVHVVRSTEGEINQEVVLHFDQSTPLILKEAWRSPSGIVCKVTAYEQNDGLPKGTFECESQEGYKAQIALDCSQHNSKETSAYLFFGLVGKFENAGNFYVWCQ